MKLSDRRGDAFVHFGLAAWAILVFGFLLLPLLVVVPISFSAASYLQFPPESYSLRWYVAYFNDRSWMDATILSVKIGIAATFMTLLLGLPFAFGVTRGLQRYGNFLEKISLAPMIVPTIVYSVSMYSLFSGMGLVGNWFGIALAHTVICFPFAAVVLCAGLREFDVNQEFAAIGLGASRLTAFRRITLPQMRASFLSAAFLSFIMSFDELVVSLFLSGTFGTLPKKMFESVKLAINPTIAAVSVMEMVILFIAMIVVIRLNKGKTHTLT